MLLLSIDDFTFADHGIDPALIDKSSAHLDFGADRRSGSYTSLFFGSSAQPASWRTNIICPDQETRDALMAVLAAQRETQVRLLADLDTADDPLLVTIDASVSSIKWPGSGWVLTVAFESDSSIWLGVDVESVTKTFESSLDQVVHLPAPGNVPTQPVIRITPQEQRTETTAAVGWQYRQRHMIANGGDEPLFRYPVMIPIGDSAALISGGKALASGDDVRVWLHGIEQARALKNWEGEAVVWVIVPALPPGEALTYEIVYGNPSANPPAEDGVELLGQDLPAFDYSTSSNYLHRYLTATSAFSAAKGLWPLSSPLEGGSADFGVPGAWMPALTFENPSNSDSYVQPRAQRLEDGTAEWYQARLYAARWRGPGFDNFDAYAGSDPYDGVVLHNPFGVRAVRSEGIRYRNDAYDKTIITTTVGDTTETSEVLTPHDPPYTRVVVIGRNSGGESWHVLQEYGQDTVTPLNRLYLQAVTAAAISPAVAAGWEHSNSPLSRFAAISQPTVIGSGAYAFPGSVTANNDVVVAQYVYALPPGVAFTTGQTVKGQLRAIEGTGGNDLRAQVVIRVIATDGTVRATLFDFDNGAIASEFGTAATNRKFPRGGAVSLQANYTSVDGDYLVMEYGFRGHTTTSVVGVLRLGVTGDVDLPENETETSNYNPWIEFSTDLSGEGYVTDTPVWTPPSPVKHFGVACWPASVISIPEGAESRVSVESTGDITVHIAAENLVVSQIEGETEIYELATELRLHGGGNAAGPYRTLLVGNARQASGPGTPRAALRLDAFHEQGLQIDTDLHTHTVWDETFTTQEETLSAHAVRALEGVLVEIDAADIPALERIALTVPNGDFASDLTGWEQHTTDADWTYAATHDAAVGGIAAGAMKIAATVTDAGTVLRRSTTFQNIFRGDSVEVRAWVRQDEAGSSSPRLGVAWYDADQILLSTELDGFEAALLNPNVDHELMFAGSPPPGAFHFRPVVGITATGNAVATKWFDDVQATRIRPLRYDGSIAKVTEEMRSARWLPVAPPRRTVPNGTFDDDITGWALEYGGVGITQAASHDAAVGGEENGSLKIAITVNSGSEYVIYRTVGFFAVGGAEQVEMSAWMQTDDEDIRPQLCLLWYGDESDTLITLDFEDPLPGPTPPEDAGYERSFAALVPPGITRFRLGLMADIAAVSATGSCWFDDIRINGNALLVADVNAAELVVEALVRPRWTP